ncbi:MAG: Holliday junction resolvase RecU [Lentisphaeria bacterium]|nr:Holliday junction resolvase RecU [Lentisphaeria bacterium]
MTEYANRGKGLERAIRKLFESYRSRGIHCQQNHPEQLFDGTITHRHGFDFQIYYKGRFLAFDAKECASHSWPLDKAKMHQLKALLDVEKNGGEAFFLVYFTKDKRLVKFAASLIQESITNGEKSISQEKGTFTALNILEIE